MKFKPGEYTRKMIFQSVTQAAGKKKGSTPNGRPTYDLLVICLGALTLSNRRLKELKPLN